MTRVDALKALLVTVVAALKALLVTVVAASLVAFVAPEAGAHHRPNTYCSESGDICQSVRKVDGVRKLRIDLAALYFRVFHLCVVDPGGWEICAPYRIKERADGTFGKSVAWFKHYRKRDPGAYRVTWKVDYKRVGARLGFHEKRAEEGASSLDSPQVQTQRHEVWDHPVLDASFSRPCVAGCP